MALTEEVERVDPMVVGTLKGIVTLDTSGDVDLSVSAEELGTADPEVPMT